MMVLVLACTASRQNDTADSTPWDTAVYPAEGGFCDPAEQIGVITVYSLPPPDGPRLVGRVWDRPHPWVDDPVVQDDVCAFYDGQPCEDCPEPRGLKATAIVNGQEFPSDDETQLIWGEFSGDRFELGVRFAGGTATTEPLDTLEDIIPSVSAAGSMDQPGDLTLSWTGEDRGQVFTRIPMNHHGSAYAWTQCMTDASEGRLVAPAEMVNPLSIITGLEYQGLSHGQFVAAETDMGCVQFSVQRLYKNDVQFAD